MSHLGFPESRQGLSVADVLKRVAAGDRLDAGTAEAVMHELMSGSMTPVQIAGLLSAIAVRGETVEEIVGFARAMRAHAVRIEPSKRVLDTCGTGGDGADTFNISTAAAFVCAAAGVPVAKHGNRGVSSRSGSADVLQALGARVNLTASEALVCLERANFCFLFAPVYHPAMKYAAEPRKQLGFRTVFNILGPLTNPAGAKRQVLGVFRPDLVDKLAQALARLGTEFALVVHGAGGLDEFSLAGETLVAEVRGEEIQRYALTPDQVGLDSAPVRSLVGGSADENAAIVRAVFRGERGPRRDAVALNAGAALYAAGKAASIAEGVQMAQELIDNGAAEQAMDTFVRLTQQIRPAEVAQ
jgi:anthranilate phosphoribosyltransferase